MLTARRGLAAASVLAALALGACSAPASDTAASSTGAAADCSTDALQTKAKGKLTIATDSPAYAPWFVDDEPSNGKGYESAVAYAIADELGFAKDDVVWTKATFNSVVQPGDKKFDLDLNQVSISDARKKAVDFSSGYYDVTQTVITTNEEISRIGDVTENVNRMSEHAANATQHASDVGRVVATVMKRPGSPSMG